MLTIFISLGLGFLLGCQRFLQSSHMRINSVLQTVWLLALIFVMGMGIGGDTALLKNLPSLGWQALLFAFFCAGGSILVVYLISHFLFKKEGEE